MYLLDIDPHTIHTTFCEQDGGELSSAQIPSRDPTIGQSQMLQLAR